MNFYTRMGEFVRIGLALLLMFSGASVPAQEAPAIPDSVAVPGRPAYTINPGDVMTVSVWKEEDLARQIVVRPDGRFSFPLVSDIQAQGKSVTEIKEDLTKKLTTYIPDPVVTITVDNMAGNVVYVIGQVNRPGQFVASADLDVLQALAMAGGTSVFAQLDDIKILRRTNGKLIAIPFDYGDIEKGKRLEQNIMLNVGDVVVVP
jgi:polysaccharide export outer membrane protein